MFKDLYCMERNNNKNYPQLIKLACTFASAAFSSTLTEVWCSIGATCDLEIRLLFKNKNARFSHENSKRV